MSCPTASDDIKAAVTIQVRSQSIFAGHAAVVDGVPLEGERLRAGPGVEHEHARPTRPGGPGLLGSR